MDEKAEQSSIFVGVVNSAMGSLPHSNDDRIDRDSVFDDDELSGGLGESEANLSRIEMLNDDEIDTEAAQDPKNPTNKD